MSPGRVILWSWGAESLGIGSNAIKQMFNLAPCLIVTYLRAPQKLINLQNLCGHEKAAKVVA